VRTNLKRTPPNLYDTENEDKNYDSCVFTRINVPITKRKILDYSGLPFELKPYRAIEGHRANVFQSSTGLMWRPVGDIQHPSLSRKTICKGKLKSISFWCIDLNSLWQVIPYHYRMVHIFVNSYTASNPSFTDCISKSANSLLLKIFREHPAGILHTVEAWKPWW